MREPTIAFDSLAGRSFRAVLLATIVLSLSGSTAQAVDVDLQVRGSWPGHTRGPIYDVALSGDYAYVALGEGGLGVFDISDPAHSELVGQVETAGFAGALAVAGDYVYVGDNSGGLVIVDIRDPTRPQVAGIFEATGPNHQIEDVAVVGNCAYLAAWLGGLQIIDISDPTNPQLAGSHDLRIRAYRVAVLGSHAYVLSRTGHDLQIIDVVNPTHPFHVTGLEFTRLGEIALDDEFVYMTDVGRHQLRILDASDPTQPVRSVGYDPGADLVGPVVVEGGLVYLLTSSGLEIIDHREPLMPKTVKVIELEANTLDVSGERAFVGTLQGIEILDLSNPVNPVSLGKNTQLLGEAFDVVISGDRAYVADGLGGLQILDITEPTEPRRLGYYETESWVHGVAVQDDVVLLINEASLLILDAALPAAPELRVRYGFNGYPVDLAVSGQFVYLLVGDRDAYGPPNPAILHVLDISDLGHTQLAALHDVGSSQMTVSGDLVFLYGCSGLEVLEVSNAGHLRLLSRYVEAPTSTSYYTYGVCVQGVSVSGTRAVVASAELGGYFYWYYEAPLVTLFDVSEPTHLQPVGHALQLEEIPGEPTVSGDYAYLQHQGNLLAIDIRDPLKLTVAGSLEINFQAMDASGRYAYLASGRAGLQIVDVSGFPNPERVVDLGDAPDFGTALGKSYPTHFDRDGARHRVPFEGASLWLGLQPPDIDTDDQAGISALGDDERQIDDEEGVVFPQILFPDQSMPITVTANAAGFLNAWIDYNKDGDWDDAEDQIFADYPLAAGGNTLTLNVPPLSVEGVSYARFRLSSQTGLTPRGEAIDGEVEDYVVILQDNAAPKALSNQYTLLENGHLTGNVLADDTGQGLDHDGESDLMSPKLVVPPNHAAEFGLNGDGSFVYRPLPDYYGSDSFDYQVTDGLMESEVASVFLDVVPVNHPPAFEKGPDLEVIGGRHVFPGWVASFTAGVSNESHQRLQFHITTDHPELFSEQPSINAAGDLMASAAQDSSGVATVTVILMDDGGTENGGVDTSEPQTFTITVAQAKLMSVERSPGNFLGWAVALSGDVCVAGAPFADPVGSSSGVAHLFERNVGGVDVWGHVRELIAYDAAVADQFGTAVAVSGSTVLVGARYHDASGPDSGAAYLFERESPGTWGGRGRLVGHDSTVRDYFGTAVALSGDIAVVGAYGDDDVGSQSGSVYVFERRAGGPKEWGEVAKLRASDQSNADVFGYRVAIDGNLIAVGASANDDACPEDIICQSGAAYLFERNTAGQWIETKKLIASDARRGARFGDAISVDGNTVAVGSSGAVYLFERDAGGADEWGEIIKLSPEEGVQAFGTAVSLDHNQLAVGAAGYAYLFSRHQGGIDHWGRVKTFTALGDRFGFAVALDGEVLAVGAEQDDQNGVNAGAVYLFRIGPEAFGDPVLAIERSAGATQIRLRWPVTDPSFGVQCAPRVTGPWFPLNAPVALANEVNEIIVDPTPPMKFFRLFRQ